MSIITLPTANKTVNKTVNNTPLTDDQYDNLMRYGKKDEFFIESVGTYNIVTFVKNETPEIWILNGKTTCKSFKFESSHTGLDELFTFLNWLRGMLEVNLSLDMKQRNKELKKLFKSVFGREFKFSTRKRDWNSIRVECLKSSLDMSKKQYPAEYWGAHEFKSMLTTAFEWLIKRTIESGASYRETSDYGTQPSFYAWFSWS